MSRGFQKSINRMSRASLGVLSPKPVAFLQAEGGSVPAEARLDRRQESFAIRLASAPPGPHTDLLRATSGLGHRIRAMVPGIGKQDIERNGNSQGRSFPGEVIIPPAWRGEEKDEGIRAAIREAAGKEKDPDTIWTDGSRLDDGGVGARVAWYEEVAGEGGTTFFSRRDFRTAGEGRRIGTLITEDIDPSRVQGMNGEAEVLGWVGDMRLMMLSLRPRLMAWLTYTAGWRLDERIRPSRTPEQL